MVMLEEFGEKVGERIAKSVKAEAAMVTRTAWQLGLGTWDLQKIDRRRITAG